MDRIVIHGGKPLKGEVRVSGSKNATLPIMVSALLAETPSIIKNVPKLRDIDTMAHLLRYVGAEVEQKGDTLIIDPRGFERWKAPYDMVRKMRASIYVLGPMIARLHRAQVAMPGGCVIGHRPIDIHLRGIQALGAKVSMEYGDVVATAQELKGAEVSLEGPYGSSVGATCNMMMAAALAKGTTVLRSAACEPEVVDLANFLNAMNARITGAGTPTITIEGVDSLQGTSYNVIPDRIEAGTFLTAVAITRGDAIVRGCRAEHLEAVITKLREIGVSLEILDDGIRVFVQGELRPVSIRTMPYPGFPTDMQAQFTALLSLVKGESIVKETVFPERFMHCAELRRMQADISVSAGSAIIRGVEKLRGAYVMASDLRASASLVVAGLAAEGKTEILRVYHIDRGYERIEEKLQQLGADIYRYDPAKMHKKNSASK
ncbi:UDP-N-acetylglucosamine 1-carboxyvinyltransferase [Candidatus Sumerlaeota bacterium]|nr:UDP-N-acetylglucosamine 1-carboxyvinyltransferase [Candidatus Sumerlaeota bacterium]